MLEEIISVGITNSIIQADLLLMTGSKDDIEKGCPLFSFSHRFIKTAHR